ncbi:MULTISPECIES: LacI family DNA-binding transcriptional regulator [Halomonadaceae]|jgi:LacI family transcriptional regulator|uniref:LacI family DNA-binding transcriptional regulator n=1 Tax=Halomonadaceae TaxID=28256 RepID=UPI001582A449|nr:MULTISPECIES: LacI family DNA-binding transcriptional regulator [Halomonas]MDI4636368.1 LacI family DNA-binding transcriptional regulator [Halomonas sp. BMC7]NUJ60731.1 LacI family DNA-binding transcriptional regulator [Halomonas taeanensis]|tara:strand:+ start:12133 stop:13128 length:996 start_codon:yes stop_codon:yes gene_type:complete
MSTIKEVASLAGVSPATVSRVMNGEVPVAEKTRQRVEDAMQRLGYRPNSFARSLASNRSDCIGLVISHLAGPFMGTMMVNLEERLRLNQKSLLVSSGHNELSREMESIDFLMSRRCDGLLVQSDRLSDDALIALATEIPLVVINRLVPALASQCSYVDNQRGSYLATRHLIQQGHCHIACITGPLWKQDAAQRLAGFRQAMAEAGLQVPEAAVIEGSWQESSGRIAVDTLRQRNLHFTALAVGNDDMAIGAMMRLQALGLNVPRDVSLVGFDDEVYAHYVTPGLTSVHVPVDRMAQAASGRLLSLAYDEPWEGERCFATHLVERGTVAPPP